MECEMPGLKCSRLCPNLSGNGVRGHWVASNIQSAHYPSDRDSFRRISRHRVNRQRYFCHSPLTHSRLAHYAWSSAGEEYVMAPTKSIREKSECSLKKGKLMTKIYLSLGLLFACSLFVPSACAEFRTAKDMQKECRIALKVFNGTAAKSSKNVRFANVWVISKVQATPLCFLYQKRDSIAYVAQIIFQRPI